jgi:hypothetical protein
MMMNIVLLILGIFNIFFAGHNWGLIDTLKLLDKKPTIGDYIISLFPLSIGIWCLIYVVGRVI